MADEELREMCESVMKHELKASETMREIGANYTVGEVNEAMSGVVSTMMENIESPEREESVYKLLYVLGQQLGSKSMMKEAASNLERMEQEATG